jgi:hypothetical protein
MSPSSLQPHLRALALCFMMPRLRGLGFRKDAQRAATREMPHTEAASLSVRAVVVSDAMPLPPRSEVDALVVLIVGAGLSRIRAAHPLQQRCLDSDPPSSSNASRSAHAGAVALPCAPAATCNRPLSLPTLDRCERLARAGDGVSDTAREPAAAQRAPLMTQCGGHSQNAEPLARPEAFALCSMASTGTRSRSP